MLGRLHGRQRGDTLIEVLFAVTVFSLVAVGSLSIMNQGSATAERSLEITLVRAAIEGQTETLRFLNASFIAAYQPGSNYAGYSSGTPAGQWAAMGQSIVARPVTNPTSFGTTATTCPAPPSGSFILDPQNAQFISPTQNKLFATDSTNTFSQLVYTSNGNQQIFSGAYGIWIEAFRSTITPGYIDFHINACWPDPSLPTPLRLGTIVRLYEPRG